MAKLPMVIFALKLCAAAPQRLLAAWIRQNHV